MKCLSRCDYTCVTNIKSMYQLCGNDKMKGVNYFLVSLCLSFLW